MATEPTRTGNSLLMSSALWRLAAAVLLIAGLWLAVAWAMAA